MEDELSIKKTWVGFSIWLVVNFKIGPISKKHRRETQLARSANNI
jgi:hypothetical protein